MGEQAVGDVLELHGHALLRLFQLGTLGVQLLLQTAAALGFGCEQAVQVHGFADALLILTRLLVQSTLQFRAFCRMLLPQ